MFVDFVTPTANGLQGSGEVGQVVAGGFGGMRFEPGLLRPYLNDRGQKVCTVNTGRTVRDPKSGLYVPERRVELVSNLVARGVHSPVFNATSLRKEEWIKLDGRVIEAARYRLRAWTDLASRNTYGGFNAFGKTILEYETTNDPGEAVQDMDGVAEGRNDPPKFQLEGLPLPITHSDFFMTSRQLAVSRNGGTPLDSRRAAFAARRVAETIEQQLIGTITGVTYGGNSTQVGGYGRTSAVYGYTTFPGRITKTNLTTPTGSNPEATVTDVLAMLNVMRSYKFYGPFMLYHSGRWDNFLDNDYARLGGSNANMTLRDRLRKIDDIVDVRRLDYLNDAADPYTLILVQMTSDVVEAVNGMDITTVQWEEKGGMLLKFKVMCIMVPWIKADFYGNCGLMHATNA